MAEENLDNVRERIRQIDLELIAHAAERSKLVKQVGEIKRRKNIATVDYSQERAVLERARCRRAAWTGSQCGAGFIGALDPRVSDGARPRKFAIFRGGRWQERGDCWWRWSHGQMDEPLSFRARISSWIA